MKRLLMATLLLALGTGWVRAGETNDDHEAAILQAVESYVAAFNRGDAAAVASLWHEDGEWISPGGDRIKGRQAIQAEMEAYFEEGGGRIDLGDPQIRFLAPSVAVEEGRASVFRRGELPFETTYLAIHVKTDKGWKLESVRETEVPSSPSNFHQLKDLDWMVGSWVDQDENATLETTCEWTKNRNCLKRSFALEVSGKIEQEGTQVIGWDAADGVIRSWVFDSAGGFAEGLWSRDGDRWLVKNSQKLRDGRRASSINIITYIDEDTFSWESTGREIDGQMQPSVDPVTVVRKTSSGLSNQPLSTPSIELSSRN